jgi:hypothetical protein
VARFTAPIPLNIRLPGGFEIAGAAGVTHRVPDELYDEVHRDVEPQVPGGFNWILQDEGSVLVNYVADLATKYDKTGGAISGDVDIAGDVSADNAVFQGSPWIDARAYGVVGNGVADDTVALQVAINSLTATGNWELFIPAGTYKITAALTLPYMQGKKIRGAGPGGGQGTIIRQDTLTVPIIKTTAEDTHSTDFGDIALEYTSQATNSGAMAIQFTATSAGIGSGWYKWFVHNVRIDKAHTGIGVAGTGSLPVWAMRFVDVWIIDAQARGLYFVSPTVQGMNNLQFENVMISNTGSTVKSTGIAITLNAGEATFTNCGVEGWIGQVYYGDGGFRTKFAQIHIESHSHTTGGYLFEQANGPLAVEDATIGINSINASGATVAMFRAHTGAGLTVDRVDASVPTLTAGTAVMVSTDSTAPGVWMRNVSSATANVSIPAHSGDTVTLARINAGAGQYGFGPPRGTAFPTSPVTSDRFWRTDLAGGMEFFYDGTRWASMAPIPVPIDAAEAATATPTILSGVRPRLGGTNFYYTGMEISLKIATTHSSTAFWDITLYDENSGVIFTGSTSWGIVAAADTWGFTTETPNVRAGATAADGAVKVRFIKNGTPGAVTARVTLFGRIVAT